jgi:hypothetical protein
MLENSPIETRKASRGAVLLTVTLQCFRKSPCQITQGSKKTANHAVFLFKFLRLPGIEPGTSALGVPCSIQLSYKRMFPLEDPLAAIKTR